MITLITHIVAIVYLVAATVSLFAGIHVDKNNNPTVATRIFMSMNFFLTVAILSIIIASNHIETIDSMKTQTEILCQQQHVPACPKVLKKD